MRAASTKKTTASSATVAKISVEMPNWSTRTSASSTVNRLAPRSPSKKRTASSPASGTRKTQERLTCETDWLMTYGEKPNRKPATRDAGTFRVSRRARRNVVHAASGGAARATKLYEKTAPNSAVSGDTARASVGDEVTHERSTPCGAHTTFATNGSRACAIACGHHRNDHMRIVLSRSASPSTRVVGWRITPRPIHTTAKTA